MAAGHVAGLAASYSLVVSSGWLFLAAMVVVYGIANLLQSIAAARTDLHLDFHPRLLLKLGRHKTYLIGIGCQFGGFALAFLARRDLPLYLVQSAVAAGLGITAVLGVAVRMWRLPGTVVVLLVLLGMGLTALILSAEPTPSRRIGVAGIALLALALPLIGAVGYFTARLHGSFVPSISEYFRFFGLDCEKLKFAKPDALIMHPGPLKRGVYIDSEVADDLARSVIHEQVEMGVAVRMACLEALIGGRRNALSGAAA